MTPAFPRPSSTVTVWEEGHPTLETEDGHQGMSLREWYAGQALPGVLVARRDEITTPESIAAECFALADALLAASQRVSE